MYLPRFHRESLVNFKDINDKKTYGVILWNNKDFVIGGHSLFITEWIKKGITYVKDLLREDRKILSKTKSQEKFGLNRIDILLYNAIKLKFSKWMKDLTTEYKIDIHSGSFKIKDSLINVKLARSKDYYELLIDIIYEKPSSLPYWEKDGMLNNNYYLTT